jgi:predicted nuclease of predicted toxin-antitoxin system
LRIKLDENMPTDARTYVASLGHDVDTVADEGLSGAPDPVVVAAATRDKRLLITLDRGLGDIRQFPLGTHAGIAVLRLDTFGRAAVNDSIARLLAYEHLEQLAGCVVVVRGHLMRVRRPS